MSRITNFQDARNELAKFYGNSRPGPYTLDTMRALLKLVDDPQQQLKVVHVAGTSGKTSTVYFVAALLTAAGHSTGLTVSPHVHEINDRVQFNMVPQPEADFCQKLDEFLKIIGSGELKPSYFEVMIAFAYWQFARAKVDYAVIEVGLGGLFDGTNVVDRPDKVCVITDIGLDHTEILGDTVEQIAIQKAGIIQPENHVFIYQQSDEIMEAVSQATIAKHAMVHVVPDKSASAPHSQLPVFQQRNIWLAAYAANYVQVRDTGQDLTARAINTAAKTIVPARMEIHRHNGKTIIVDGSHNYQKISTLLESVRARYPDATISALVAFVEGPDDRWQGGLDALLPQVKHIIVTSFQGAQDVPKPSLDPAHAATFIAQHDVMCDVVKDPTEAFTRLLKEPTDIHLVVGSFYLLNDILPLLSRSKP